MSAGSGLAETIDHARSARMTPPATSAAAQVTIGLTALAHTPSSVSIAQLDDWTDLLLWIRAHRIAPSEPTH